MKLGYEIQVQADIPGDLKVEAIKFAQQWGEDHKGGYGLGKVSGSDRRTYYNRGSFGRLLGHGWNGEDEFIDSGLVFRRISRNRRVFGIVHMDTLERVDGEPILIEQCMCPQHRGGQRVRFRERPQMETVFTWGDVKG